MEFATKFASRYWLSLQNPRDSSKCEANAIELIAEEEVGFSAAACAASL